MKKYLFLIFIMIFIAIDMNAGIVKFALASLKDYKTFVLRGNCQLYDSDNLEKVIDEGTLKIWVEQNDLKLILKSKSGKNDINITFPLRNVKTYDDEFSLNNGTLCKSIGFKYMGNIVCFSNIGIGSLFVIKYGWKTFDVSAYFMSYYNFEGELIPADNGSDYQTPNRINKWFKELHSAIIDGEFIPKPIKPITDFKPEY